MSNVSKDFVTKNGIVIKGNSIVTGLSGQTNALQVDSGASIAKNLLVGTTATIYGVARIANTTTALNTTSGALVVDGGLAVAQDIQVGGTIYGNVLGSISTATNLSLGTAGQLVYQSAPGVTAFHGPGSIGDILVSNGTGGPLYTGTASIYVNDAVNADTVRGGTAGQLLYQINTGTTGFVGPGSLGDILTSAGTGVPVYISTGSIYVGRALVADSATGTSGQANNLSGGILGQIPYQLGPNSTAFIGTGTNGSLLQMGANTATFVTTSNVYVNSSVNAENLFGGTAGQLVYQSASGATAFVGPGSAGELLISGGTSGPKYQNTLTVDASVVNVNSTLASTSTTTGALVVDGGVGVAGSVYVGDRMGFVNTGNSSVVYQVYNPFTNTLDTVWG